MQLIVSHSAGEMVTINTAADEQGIAFHLVKVLEEVDHYHKALAVDSLDVNLVRVASEAWRAFRYGMLRIALADVTERANVDFDALVLHHDSGWWVVQCEVVVVNVRR